MVALQSTRMPRLVNFGLQTPEIHTSKTNDIGE